MGLFDFHRRGPAKHKDPMRKGLRALAARDVLRYTHMPEILPRIRALGQKFGHFAFMLALVFRSARLLPSGHPMLNPVNVGRYGIRDVVATAANGLTLKRENTDQILMFGAVVMAMIMIVIQAVLIGLYALMGSAQASNSMFTTPTPDKDLVFQFLRNVFGVQDIFGPNAVSHPGFHAILGFYSTAMMIMAVLIVVYYVVTIVGESAQTGQPFGRRFNTLWAPVRLVLALGLLVPLGGGLNAAQYLTLYMAKFGSGLATQGWIRFTDTFNDPAAFVRGTASPPTQMINASIFAAEACRATYNRVHSGTNKPVGIFVSNGLRSQAAAFDESDLTFAVGTNNPYGLRPVKLMYVWSAERPGATHAVASTCGAINMDLGTAARQASGSMQAADQLTQQLQVAYVRAMGNLVRAISGSLTTIDYGATSYPSVKFARKSVAVGGGEWITDSAVEVDEIANMLGPIFDAAQVEINTAVQAITWDGQAHDDLVTAMKQDARERGWGTAGIYYLEMSKMTQALLDAVNKSYPAPVTGPDGLKQGVKEQSFWTWLTETLFGDADKQVRSALAGVNEIISRGVSKMSVETVDHTNTVKPAGTDFSERGGSILDPMMYVARWMFGDAFLLLLDSPTLNPMGSLIQGGAYILDRVKSLTYLYMISQAGIIGGAIYGGLAGGAAGAVTGPGAIGTAIGGAVLGMMISQLAGMLGGLIWLFMVVGMAAGIVLFYLLPLMPFMYFFFSVVNWVIEVAEAVVSMPLFALSHLRIDGEGLPGQTAYQGWLTLFGVMLRPLMIVIGLIVGSLVFNAGAYFLAQTYKYAIFAYNPDAQGAAGMDFSNVSAFGLITYLILFVYLIYMLANSSFKLIDQIPDKMMRWIGGPTPFTGDRPVDLGNMQNVALAGYVAAKEFKGAADGVASGAQGMAKGRIESGGPAMRKGPSVGGSNNQNP